MAPLPCSASRTAVTAAKNEASSRSTSVRSSAIRTGTTAVIRPGRGDITTTRCDRNTASGIECVTNTTAAPLSPQIRTSSVCIRSRVISSSAPNGSSMSSRLGRSASARAIATRCCMPPDSWCGKCPANSSRPTSASSSAARAARSFLPTPCSSSGSSTLPATSRHGSSPACWNAMP